MALNASQLTGKVYHASVRVFRGLTTTINIPINIPSSLSVHHTVRHSVLTLYIILEKLKVETAFSLQIVPLISTLLKLRVIWSEVLPAKIIHTTLDIYSVAVGNPLQD